MGPLARIGLWFAKQKAAGKTPLRDAIQAAGTIASALDRDDVQIERGRDVADATNAVVDALAANPDIAIARTTTPSRDPINWTQFVGVIVWLGAAFGLELDPAQVVAVGTGIQVAITLVTGIIRKRSKTVSV